MTVGNALNRLQPPPSVNAKNKFVIALKLGFVLLTGEQRRKLCTGKYESNTKLKEDLGKLDEWAKRGGAAVEKKVTSRRKAYWQGLANSFCNNQQVINLDNFLPEKLDSDEELPYEKTFRNWIVNMEEDIKNQI